MSDDEDFFEFRLNDRPVGARIRDPISRLSINTTATNQHEAAKAVPASIDSVSEEPELLGKAQMRLGKHKQDESQDLSLGLSQWPNQPSTSPKMGSSFTAAPANLTRRFENGALLPDTATANPVSMSFEEDSDDGDLGAHFQRSEPETISAHSGNNANNKTNDISDIPRDAPRAPEDTEPINPVQYLKGEASSITQTPTEASEPIDSTDHIENYKFPAQDGSAVSANNNQPNAETSGASSQALDGSKTETKPPGDTEAGSADRDSGAKATNGQTSPKAHYTQNSLGELEPLDGDEKHESDEDWQPMATVGSYEIYDDANNLLRTKEIEETNTENAAASGYTRVFNNDDTASINSLDDKTDFLFEGVGNDNPDDDVDASGQIQTTKSMLTDQQRIAYVGLCRLVLADMGHDVRKYGIKNNHALESLQVWGSKIVLRLYAHMELDNDEQLMIEQLASHDVFAEDLTICLKSVQKVSPEGEILQEVDTEKLAQAEQTEATDLFTKDDIDPEEAVRTETVEVDVKWTVMCDLFLMLLSEGVYDSRSRTMLEIVGKHLGIKTIGVAQFERKVTEALQIDDAADQDWTEQDIIEQRRKRGIKRKIAYMGLATLGGGLVIGLSAGLLAPVIGAGLAAGLTTIGITGTSGFLAGAGGAAIVTTTGTVIGAHVGNRSMAKRVGHVKTFEFRPIFNNHRMNMIVTVSGWMTGKFDDVRLPFSTIDPMMGDVMSVLWEPEVMRSLGQTINILATEALTQSVQQILGATILTALMSSVQLPMWLAKLSYLLDNPWSVSLDRAWAAGKILADVLMQRNVGERPVTLMGFSLGARVIYSCLSELARRNAFGLVQDVFLFGTPVFYSKKSFAAARSVVSGRFVSGYSSRDWILAFLFPASRKYGVVLGLTPIPDADATRLRVENTDVTADVDGHMSYRTKIPKLLADCGISVLSEEFEEIEDPDPNKLREKQRKLLTQLEGKHTPKKGIWPFNKMSWLDKAAESSRSTSSTQENDKRDGDDEYLFDVDAIRNEMHHVNPEMIFDAEDEETAGGDNDADKKLAKEAIQAWKYPVDESRLPEFEDEPETPSVPLYHPDERDIVLEAPPAYRAGSANAGTDAKTNVVMTFDDDD